MKAKRVCAAQPRQGLQGLIWSILQYTAWHVKVSKRMLYVVAIREAGITEKTRKKGNYFILEQGLFKSPVKLELN